MAPPVHSAPLLILTRTARTLGVPLPAAFTEQIAADQRVMDAAERFKHPAKLRDTVLDAIVDGRDYYADEDIRRMLLDSVVSSLGLVGEAHARAERNVKSGLVEHADAILESWADALAPHGDALATAAAALPTPDLDDTGAIASSGTDALRHWANAQEAIKLWRAGIEGFVHLAMLSHINVRGGKRDPLIVTPADRATIGEAEATAMREGKPVDVWMLARHDAPLRLASSFGEYMERIAADEQQRRAAELAYDRQRAEEVRKHVGSLAFGSA